MRIAFVWNHIFLSLHIYIYPCIGVCVYACKQDGLHSKQKSNYLIIKINQQSWSFFCGGTIVHLVLISNVVHTNKEQLSLSVNWLGIKWDRKNKKIINNNILIIIVCIILLLVINKVKHCYPQEIKIHRWLQAIYTWFLQRF